MLFLIITSRYRFRIYNIFIFFAIFLRFSLWLYDLLILRLDFLLRFFFSIRFDWPFTHFCYLIFFLYFLKLPFLIERLLLPILFLYFFFLFAFLFLTALRKSNLALHLIIILKDVSNELAVRNIEVTLFYPNCLDKSSLTVLVSLLILLHLSVGLLNMRQPIHHLPSPHSSAKDIDACIGCHL